MIYTFSKTRKPSPKAMPIIPPKLRQSLGNMFSNVADSGLCSQCPKESRNIPYVKK